MRLPYAATMSVCTWKLICFTISFFFVYLSCKQSYTLQCLILKTFKHTHRHKNNLVAVRLNCTNFRSIGRQISTCFLVQLYGLKQRLEVTSTKPLWQTKNVMHSNNEWEKTTPSPTQRGSSVGAYLVVMPLDDFKEEGWPVLYWLGEYL